MTRSMSLLQQREHIKAEIARTVDAINEQIEATRFWQWRRRKRIEKQGAADLDRLEKDLASVKKNLAIAADQKPSKGLMSRRDRQRLMRIGQKRGQG